MTLRNAFDAVATETTLQGVRRGLTDYEVRLDYGARLDANPEYVGKAPQGTLATAAAWTVQRLSYDASGRLVRAQVLSGLAWDSRATAGWS